MKKRRIMENMRQAQRILTTKTLDYPDDLNRLREKALEPNAKVTDFVKILENNSTLLGDYLKVANRCREQAPKFLNTLSAVNYYGPFPSYLMVLGNYMEACATTGSASEKQVMEHSKQVALVASQIAHWVQEVAPWEAYSLGLLHDIGWIVALRLCPDHYSIYCHQLATPFASVNQEKDVLGTYHFYISAVLMNQWGLERDFIKAVLLHHNPECFDQTTDQKKVMKLVGVLMLANYIVAKEMDDEYMTQELLRLREVAQKGLTAIPEPAFKAGRAILRRLYPTQEATELV